MSFLETIFLVIGVALAAVVIAYFLNRQPISGIHNDQDVIELINRGEKTAAIKAYRQLHGVGLIKAKDFVDQFKLEDQ